MIALDSQRQLLRESDALMDEVERWQAGLHRPRALMFLGLEQLARRCGFGEPLPRSAFDVHGWLFELQVRIGLPEDDLEQDRVPRLEPSGRRAVNASPVNLERAFRRWRSCWTRAKHQPNELNVRLLEQAWADYYRLQEAVIERYLEEAA